MGGKAGKTIKKSARAIQTGLMGIIDTQKDDHGRKKHDRKEVSEKKKESRAHFVGGSWCFSVRGQEKER